MRSVTFLRRLLRVSASLATRPAFIFIAGALLSATMAPPAAHAQYMYLDSNGDGLHSAADVITDTGATNFDVWLSTDTNRDGSAAVCTTGDAPLEFFSYIFALRAVGGTISWVTTTNLQPAMGLEFADFGSDAEYLFGYSGFTRLPPGRHRLAQFSVTVAGGTPAIEIVRSVGIRSYETTSFGSPCSGTDFDNTIKLGTDWFDVDGLAFSTSGGINVGPVVSGPSRLVARTGEAARADYQATDANGDLIVLSLSGAPAFVSIGRISAGPGAATFRVHALPLRGDEGGYDIQVVASDGIDPTTSPLHLEVQDGGNHGPAIRSLSPIHVVVGAVASIRLEASDSDGDAITFGLGSGPEFAEVSTLGSGPSSTIGRLILRPGLCDVGSFPIEVAAVAIDGTSSASVLANVLPGEAVPAPAVRQFGLVSSAVVSADFNEDGSLDIASVYEGARGNVTVLLGDGTGDLTTAWTSPVGPGYLAVESGDWNGDGNADLAVGAFSTSPLQIFWGGGNGTFGAPTVLADVLSVNEIRTADFNADGVDDFAASSEGSNVFVLLGAANSMPGPVRRVEVGGGSKDLSIGDFNRDGRPDLAISMAAPAAVRVLYGFGDGTFGSDRSYPTGGIVYGLVEGDWDEDGILDLAAMRAYNDGVLLLLRGDASGGFVVSPPGGTYLYGYEIATADWNGDGHLDLLPSGDKPASGFQILLGDGDGAFTPGPAVALPSSYGADVLFADLDANGRPDIVWGEGLTTVLNTTPSVPQAPARAFAAQTQRAIPAAQSSGSLCVRLEALDEAFAPTEVDPATLRLLSSGTGSVSEISAAIAKSAVVGDTDRNNVDEYPACFAMSDISALFSLVRGKQDLPVRLEGGLFDGRRICARFILSIIGKGSGALAARVEPNPLNPEGTLRFATKSAGQVTIRLFDVNGRLVRSLWNARPTSPGPQEARIDGRDSAGRTLRSGVYFYRIDGVGMNETGRFTILK